MQSSTDVARRHFYGTCAILLGAWELAAFAGALPTITETVRSNPWVKPIVATWMAGLAVHLLRRGA